MPHGTTFAVPVLIHLPFSGTPTDPVILRLDDETDQTWETLFDGSFEDSVATLEASQFSIYAVADEAPVPLPQAGVGGSNIDGGGSFDEDTIIPGGPVRLGDPGSLLEGTDYNIDGCGTYAEENEGGFLTSLFDGGARSRRGEISSSAHGVSGAKGIYVRFDGTFYAGDDPIGGHKFVRVIVFVNTHPGLAGSYTIVPATHGELDVSCYEPGTCSGTPWECKCGIGPGEVVLEEGEAVVVFDTYGWQGISGTYASGERAEGALRIALGPAERNLCFEEFFISGAEAGQPGLGDTMDRFSGDGPAGVLRLDYVIHY